jgi:hypothetical protein
MPLTAWKERRITCQLGCSDPFCDLTSAQQQFATAGILKEVNAERAEQGK